MATKLVQGGRSGGAEMSAVMDAAKLEAASILEAAAERASAVLAGAARYEALAARYEARSEDRRGGLHHNPSVNHRYERRLKAARQCQEILANTGPFEFEANYGVSSKRSVSRHHSDLLAQMADAVIAKPDAHGMELGGLFGHGATWFNTVFREGLVAAGVAQ